MDKLRVAVLFGGRSEEHTVSVKSAREIAAHIDTGKYEPIYIGITKSGLWGICEKPSAEWEDRSLWLSAPGFANLEIDVVLPMLHGKTGEDGKIQGFLEVCGIRWDAKYATWDNFTGKPVDGYEVNRIAGSCELASALLETKKLAATLGFGLLLWDGYRPQRAVNYFLKWSKQPESGHTKEKYYPYISRAAMISKGYVAQKSSHTRGSAIDLTLFRLETGELAPMGSGFDFMDERSHHGAKCVSGEEQKNRHLLRSIMESSGFKAFEYEWWHYVLKKEPYPDSYFDFPCL